LIEIATNMPRALYVKDDIVFKGKKIQLFQVLHIGRINNGT
jgi:hypothetical protein